MSNKYISSFWCTFLLVSAVFSLNKVCMAQKNDVILKSYDAIAVINSIDTGRFDQFEDLTLKMSHYLNSKVGKRIFFTEDDLDSVELSHHEVARIIQELSYLGMTSAQKQEQKKSIRAYTATIKITQICARLTPPDVITSNTSFQYQGKQTVFKYNGKKQYFLAFGMVAGGVNSLQRGLGRSPSLQKIKSYKSIMMHLDVAMKHVVVAGNIFKSDLNNTGKKTSNSDSKIYNSERKEMKIIDSELEKVLFLLNRR